MIWWFSHQGKHKSLDADTESNFLSRTYPAVFDNLTLAKQGSCKTRVGQLVDQGCLCRFTSCSLSTPKMHVSICFMTGGSVGFHLFLFPMQLSQIISSLFHTSLVFAMSNLKIVTLLKPGNDPKYLATLNIYKTDLVSSQGVHFSRRDSNIFVNDKIPTEFMLVYFWKTWIQ